MKKTEAKETCDALVSRECLRNLLDSVQGSHTYFKATEAFYTVTGINCRRWAKLYRGELSVTIDELKRVYHALKVTFSTKTFARQLKIFE